MSGAAVGDFSLLSVILYPLPKERLVHGKSVPPSVFYSRFEKMENHSLASVPVSVNPTGCSGAMKPVQKTLTLHRGGKNPSALIWKHNTPLQSSHFISLLSAGALKGPTPWSSLIV